MAFSLDSITTSSVLKPPRAIVLGVEKIGKSTFAAGSDRPIFIPIKREEGIDDLNVARFPACETFGDVMSAISVLYQEDHQYQTAVIDSSSALEPVIWEDVCQENGAASIEKVNGGFGKGYVEALSRWQSIMEGLDALREHKNMASIIIGHVKVSHFNDPERDSYNRYTFDINDRASNALFRWADFIGFANNKIVTTTEKQGFGKEVKRAVDAANGNRFLFTQKTPAHPGGGRGVYGRLPAELSLSWEAFKNAVAAAV
ncbi:MAG TPA: ATP-binding protein [Chthoniobacteraceae bacterium]|nr:ATP-binding protein [Chthoniobacteraceae bacterium]